MFARHSPSPLAVPSSRHAAVTSVGVEPTRLAAPGSRPSLATSYSTRSVRQWPGRESNPHAWTASASETDVATCYTTRPLPAEGRGESRARESNPEARLQRPGRAPARPQHVELQTWESNPASRLMRPGRAPARLQGVSGDGGIRTHTFHVLSVATPAGWSTSPSRQCAGQESNLRSGARRFYRPRGLPGPTDASSQWHGWESNPQTPRFELGRYAGSRTVPRSHQSPRWESNPHVRHTKTAGSRYNTGASSERPVGVEPTHPPWRGGRRPLHHGRVSTLCGSRARLGGLRGRRPHPKSNRARRSSGSGGSRTHVVRFKRPVPRRRRPHFRQQARGDLNPRSPP